MKAFLKDRVGVSGFEFGLEVTQGLRAGIRVAALVGEVVAIVMCFVTGAAPEDAKLAHSLSSQGDLRASYDFHSLLS